ncbi:ABC transporter ATP-binding protein [Dactylosporangium sp. NPDC000521]|uniref:ABC transporter ATP-binding protein n=1 Tax=Dactylosporangium sp. NPDC000521 TaxID=3363975 RepID=UPI0036A93473
MSAVRVRGLHKRYGAHTAVDGIDLDIEDGECVALLGPNGAGKTTTVEILEGYRCRDAGEVFVLGADPQRAGPHWREQIGIVPHQAADLAEATVAEAVRHFAQYYRRPRKPSEVIDLVGLTDRAGSRLRHLSGGQRRRVDVAIGIVGNPRLLFLDEPTTGFDPEARRQFWGLLRELAAGGTTILLTTHNLDEAERLADRVAVLAGGRLVATGTPSSLGGRETGRARVTWLHGEQYSDNPAALVADLASRYGGPVPGLTVTRPSLEDVYLDLIGARPCPD